MVYSSANIDNISVCQAAIFKCLIFGFTAFLVRMITFQCIARICKYSVSQMVATNCQLGSEHVCAFLPGFTISIALESTNKQLRITTSDAIDVCAK